MSLGLRCVAWILGVACTAITANARDIQGDTQQYMRESALAANRVGYSVIDCDKGVVVASHNAQSPFAPASNLKVVTTAAALEILGQDFQFETKLVADLVDGRMILTLIGAGDPALFDPSVTEEGRASSAQGAAPRENWTTVEAAADAWAKALTTAGITQVDEFVVDARIFDDEPILTGDEKHENNQYSGTYAVGLYGFNLAGNAATLTINAPPKSRPTIASVHPPVPLTVVANEARVTPGKDSTFGVRFGKSPTQVSLSGNLPKAGEVSVGIEQVPALSAAMFARLLTERGVHVKGSRVAEANDRAPSGCLVAPTLTTPIAVVLRGANTHSKNLYAQALVKRMGFATQNARGSTVGPNTKAGTWDNGLAAVRSFLDRRLGSGCTGALCMKDGSGLSAGNRITPDLTARLLATLARDPAQREAYLESFARPGMAGTLKNRFKGVDLRGTAIYGKSGYIAGVSCLSGVVRAADGRTFSYSVLCNDPAKIGESKKFQEKIVERITRELAAARVNTARVPD